MLDFEPSYFQTKRRAVSEFFVVFIVFFFKKLGFVISGDFFGLSMNRISGLYIHKMLCATYKIAFFGLYYLGGIIIAKFNNCYTYNTTSVISYLIWHVSKHVTSFYIHTILLLAQYGCF